MFSSRVIASCLCSILCALFCFTSDATALAPAAPTAMRATAVAFDFLAVSWVDNATDETGFELEFKVGTGAFTSYSNALPVNATSYFAGYINTAGLTLTMRVRAYNLTGAGGTRLTSAYSTATAVVMPAATVTFLPPSGVSATATATSFTPTWTNNATNKTGFLVYGKPSSDPGNELLANVVNPPTTITQVYSALFNDVVPVSPGSSYSFLIYAFVTVPNASGTTDTWYTNPSAAATVITKDAATSRTGVSGIPGEPFSHTFTTTGGSPVVSRSLTSVPDTLTFDSSTGTLTGTYPAPGLYALSLSVIFANGWTDSRTFYIRVLHPAGPPLPAASFPAWTTPAGSTRDTPLAGAFTDLEAESAVRVSTTLGAMDFILFDTVTPATVVNFKNYLARYANVVFHRSIAGFVIQGGGFRSTGDGAKFTTVDKDLAVMNEPGIANVRGTLSMAKLGNSPNSATNEFFISLGDNRANLDFQNGGFTVFGRVAGNGMNVADAISHLPTRTYSLNLDGSATGTSFPDFPVNAAAAPAQMDQSLVVKMNSVTTISTLSWAIAGNTNPAVVSASIVNGQVHLVALAGGNAMVTVSATDLDNLTASQSFPVTVTDTFATWAARQTFSGGQSAENDNPDGDNLNNLLEFAFLGDPGAHSLADAPSHGLLGTAPDPRTLTVTLPVRKYTAGLTYAVEVSAALDGPWTAIWTSPEGFTHARVHSAVEAADRTLVTISDSTVIAPNTRRFVRTKITRD